MMPIERCSLAETCGPAVAFGLIDRRGRFCFWFVLKAFNLLLHYGLVAQSEFGTNGKAPRIQWSVWKIVGWTGEPGFFQPLFRAMVRDRETETGGGAGGFLVAQPAGVVAAAGVFAFLQAGLGFFIFAYAFYTGFLTFEPDHPSPAREAHLDCPSARNRAPPHSN